MSNYESGREYAETELKNLAELKSLIVSSGERDSRTLMLGVGEIDALVSALRARRAELIKVNRDSRYRDKGRFIWLVSSVHQTGEPLVQLVRHGKECTTFQTVTLDYLRSEFTEL